MPLVFGAVVAAILLGLYAYAVVTAILVVNCAATADCISHPLSGFTPGFASTLTTVGGLVSALVVAELAITRPGDPPMSRLLGFAESARAATLLKALTGVYLALWLALGLAAYVVGALWHPDILKPLTDFGQSWLGVAVASGYAYFRMTPPAGRSDWVESGVNGELKRRTENGERRS